MSGHMEALERLDFAISLMDGEASWNIVNEAKQALEDLRAALRVDPRTSKSADSMVLPPVPGPNPRTPEPGEGECGWPLAQWRDWPLYARLDWLAIHGASCATVFPPPPRPEPSSHATPRRAKLTREQAEEIRRHYATGEITQRQLAAWYRVTASCIADVIHRRTWAR